MASPISSITALFKRVMGRNEPAPTPAIKPEPAKPEPAANSVS
jgi:hypothetical protein